jgi:serine/threonine protein phosphatase PrpC
MSVTNGGRREQETCCGAGVTDRGLHYRTNQDAFAVGCDGGATAYAVVCDGVSTSPEAARAAQTAVEVTLAVLSGAGPVEDAVCDAAKAVAALHVSGEVPSCTLVCAVASNTSVTVGWLGDSRAYWLGEGSLQLTEDDAVPSSHAITRWLGADADDVTPRMRSFTPPGSGVVLLCSDGLWNYLGSADALACVTGAFPAPIDAAKRLVQLALAAGGHDNITAVLLPIPLTHGGWNR